jgi:hypothetical protein
LAKPRGLPKAWATWLGGGKKGQTLCRSVFVPAAACADDAALFLWRCMRVSPISRRRKKLFRRRYTRDQP